VNYKEKGGQQVLLADGEEDGVDGGDPMEEERGRSLSVEGGNPASENLAKSHGLQDAVHPVHADLIISIQKVQAQQKAGKLSMEELRCRENGGWAIVDGAASEAGQMAKEEEGGPQSSW
jgi:hypothetical protein